MFEKSLDWIAPIAVTIVTLLNVPAFAGTTTKIEDGATLQTVEVASDGAIVLESEEPFSELSVANPKIADISTISSTTLYVLGKQPGRTTLMLIREDGSVMSVVDVRVSPDVTELSRRLRDVLPGEEIEVLTAKDGLVLSGTVSGPEAINIALELAGHYAPGKVSNLLNVRVEEVAPEPVAEPEAAVAEEVAAPVDPSLVEVQIREILPNEQISVHELGGTIVLSGNVSSQDRAKQALQIARLVAGEVEVTNLMTVEKAQACKVRTRRGGELIETDIPCRSRPQTTLGALAPAIGNDRRPIGREELKVATPAASVESTSPMAPATSPFPRPRPEVA